jgi:serine/threonine-protein kinase
MPASQDEFLAQLLADLTEQAQRGVAVDIEAVAKQHPDLATELRSLWATAQFADDLGHITVDFGTDDEAPPELRHHDAGAVATRAGFPRRFGDYELLEEIGRGGMGVVYRARQLSLGRIVALKMILRGEFASPTDLARFRAEAAATAHLDHPHVVPVYEVGTHDGHPFFTMKLIDGSTLSRRLANGPLAGWEAAEIMLPVCGAIAAAHRHGILHRDLKPSNILLDAQGEPHVGDFGLARRIESIGQPQGATGGSSASAESLTQSGAIIGTPAYMSPEQAAGRRDFVGPASDIYNLGAILYHCLTGRPPFAAPSPVDVVLQVLEQDPPPPRLINPHVDPDLELIAVKALQKPPELRYATAAAMADDLSAYLSDEPISARSSQFSDILSRLFRETHHAAVLEHWGLLWMWHSLALLVLCFTTNWFSLRGITTPEPYLALWLMGLGTWAAIFWALRRRAGPITFVERQIAHVWAGSVVCSTMLYVVEYLLGLPVLTLSPVLGLVSGMVFLVKAGILTGAFYFQAVALFATASVMALWPKYGISIFGVVSAACFFVPGWKYYRQRVRIGRD